MKMQSEDSVNHKESRRMCVPWFCQEELDYVYTLVFSSDPEVLKKGYQYLLMWKARRSFMPPGFDATFYFCEVLLQDGKLQDFSDEVFLSQLRLSYATTIMRFLNLVLDTGPGKTEKKTLFDLADAVGIPRWIVDIRHDSAHGSILPDIEVLRSAARFSMNWLKERYWEEALQMTDLIIADGDVILSDCEQLVKNVLDCWENFSICKLARLSTKKKVQPGLWARVNEIAASLKSRKNDPVQNVTDIDEALLVLNEKVIEILRSRRIVKPTFIKRMVAMDSFLPSEEIVALFRAKSVNKTFPEALVVIWKDMMDNIWESGCVPLLLTHLVDINKDSSEKPLRREFAAHWLRQILISLVEMKESTRVLKAAAAQSRLGEVPGQELRAAVKNAVIAQAPDLEGAYGWSCLPLPRYVFSTDFAEKCLVSPPISNNLDLLPWLCALLHPPLPRADQEMLKEVLGISSGVATKSSKQPSADKLYTVADILQTNTNGSAVPKTSGSSNSKSSVIQTPATQPMLAQSPWKRSSDLFRWARSPLGILPWQSDDVNKVWKDFEIIYP